MYAVGGETDLSETILDHLTGTSSRSRCGSAMPRTARPSTTCGARLLDSVFLHLRSGEFLSGCTWKGLAEQVERAIAHWTRARSGDLGIAGRTAALHVLEDDVLGGRATAEPARRGHGQVRLAAALAGRGRHASRPTSWTRASTSAACSPRPTGRQALDASLLLAPLLRFLPADDPRIVATVLAIADELTDDGLVLRYRHRGDRRRSRRARRARSRSVRSGWSRRWSRSASSIALASCASACCPTPARSASTPKRSTRAPAAIGGTFPQAFTHLAQINALMHIIRAEEASRRRGAHGTTSAGRG